MAGSHSSNIAYFGYGSLVNRATLRTGYVAGYPARLGGWRRHWQARSRRIDPAGGNDVAMLSVHRHEAGELLGMLIIDRAENLAALDRREAQYKRIEVDSSAFRPAIGTFPAPLPETVFLYVGQKEPETAGAPKLLQSYLDAVMAGFHAEFGEAGLDHFMATTTGFDREIIADRHAPLYPRAVTVDAKIADMFDVRLKQAGVRF